jgi:5'-nucleotidase/UDP-sugar diphosphatase
LQVGTAEIVIVDGNIADFVWKPVEIAGFAPDAAVSAMLAPYVEKAEEALGEVVGRAAGEFVFGDRLTRFRETEIGNMVTDGIAWFARNAFGQTVDFAFTNGGGIRAPLPAGDITRGGILTILPFENFVYVASLSGARVVELFDFIATIPPGNGGFPQFSGEVRYTVNVRDRVVSDLTVGGLPVDPDRTYRFATNDFTLGGGDGYTVLTNATEAFSTSTLLSDAVIEYIRHVQSVSGPIVPSTDGRMVVVGGAL